MLTIEQRLTRIENLLRKQQEKPPQTWVKVVVITELTGWNKYSLHRARRNGLVKWRKVGHIVEYLLESVHPTFIKTNHGTDKAIL